jgi:hypothetical protein
VREVGRGLLSDTLAIEWPAGAPRRVGRIHARDAAARQVVRSIDRLIDLLDKLRSISAETGRA